MKHLKEGLIKQRGIVKSYNEIPNPKYKDICELGNVSIVYDEGEYTLCITLSKFLYDDGNEPILVQLYDNSRGYNFYRTSSFKDNYPSHKLDDDTKIKQVFKTNIDPDSIKTVKDLERVLKPFEIYCK